MLLYVIEYHIGQKNSRDYGEKRLTWTKIYDIVIKRDWNKVFFLCANFVGRSKRNDRITSQIKMKEMRTEVDRLCVQESHWHVQNARTVIMIRQRIRRHILTGWRQRNTANSAEHIHCTKKPNNCGGKWRFNLWLIQEISRTGHQRQVSLPV